MKQTTILGHSTLSVNRMGLGCMAMSEFYGSFDEEESIRTLHEQRADDWDDDCERQWDDANAEVDLLDARIQQLRNVMDRAAQASRLNRGNDRFADMRNGNGAGGSFTGQRSGFVLDIPYPADNSP